MNNLSWSDIHNKFKKLSEITGVSKSSSYNLIVHFDLYLGISVTFGAYDIGDYPRNFTIGPFKTEQEALENSLNVIIEFEKYLEDENSD